MKERSPGYGGCAANGETEGEGAWMVRIYRRQIGGQARVFPRERAKKGEIARARARCLRKRGMAGTGGAAAGGEERDGANRR